MQRTDTYTRTIFMSAYQLEFCFSRLIHLTAMCFFSAWNSRELPS